MKYLFFKYLLNFFNKREVFDIKLNKIKLFMKISLILLLFKYCIKYRTYFTKLINIRVKL